MSRHLIPTSFALLLLAPPTLLLSFSAEAQTDSGDSWGQPPPEEAQPDLRAMPFRVSVTSLSDDDIHIAVRSANFQSADISAHSKDLPRKSTVRNASIQALSLKLMEKPALRRNL